MSIDDLIRLFVEQHPEYGTQEGAVDSCTLATQQFMELANKAEIEVKPFVSKWRGPKRIVTHVMVYVGDGIFVDFTSKQFDASRPYPEIFHGLDEALEARGDWQPIPSPPTAWAACIASLNDTL